jgi:hypothetical protein
MAKANRDYYNAKANRDYNNAKANRDYYYYYASSLTKIFQYTTRKLKIIVILYIARD